MVPNSPRPRWQLPAGRITPIFWVGIAAIVIWSDYHGGLQTFPVLYAVPVTLAAWFSGKSTALTLAVTIPAARLLFISLGFHSATLALPLVLETLARGVVVMFLGLWVSRLSELERALERRVRVLEGMLPICAFCKKIRNDAGDWERLEAYITRRSEAEFSHGVCPACCETHYAEEMEEQAVGGSR